MGHALFNRAYRFAHTKPGSKLVQAGRLTERDRLILRALWEFRVLPTSTLYQRVALEHPTSKGAFWRVLRRLWRAEYLDRIPEVYLRVIGVESNVLWAIGKRGYEYLAPELGLPIDTARRVPEWNAAIKPLFLKHRINLNKFLICLTCALHQHERVTLHLESAQRLVVQDVVIIPDAQLALVHPDGAARFAIESDESTTPLARWARSKAWGYAEYWRAHPTAPFVVLIIAPTPARCDHLREAVARFCQAMAAQGITYPPLWRFTDRSHYSLERPETILERIWLGPEPEEPPASLLEL
jgi:hypothetical protein